ncbi:MAG: L,D-transpeptidase family protein [Clostridiaceae bacterium]|nr:L,D-transpeptidase family protein [Clostridiaceae bacterium]
MKKLILFFLVLSILLSPVKITASTLCPDNNKYIIFIEVNELSLSLIDKQTKELVKRYPIAMGKKTTPSPIGQWHITSKALKSGPFGGYWLGLNVPWDTFGIHGTSNPASIGSLASGGCIRMYNEHIKELFDLVGYDTQVIVYGGPNWRFSPYDREIKPNDKGCDVYYVQKALKDRGYFNGIIDGIYGYSLEIAVRNYRTDHNLKDTNVIDNELLDNLGLYKFE